MVTLGLVQSSGTEVPCRRDLRGASLPLPLPLPLPLSVAVAEMAWAFTQYEPLNTP